MTRWCDFVQLGDDGRGTTSGRSEYERDQDRIIFSSPFRRLNDKTQVLPIPEHYFVHNRMTHSVETSCVGRSLGSIVGERVLEATGEGWGRQESRSLGDLVQAACLAHDIGNPPFGHSGEDAISSFFARRPEVMEGLTEAERRDFTAFEGNAQGFRIISSLSPGLHLTRNTLATFTKYPRESLVQGGYDDPSQAKRRDQKKYGAYQSEAGVLSELMSSFGLPRLSRTGLAFSRHPFAFLVEAADDVCYLIIDLEDAVRLGIIALPEVRDALETIIDANPDGRSRGRSAPTGDDNERIAAYRARAINSLVFQCAAVFEERKDEIAAGTYAGSLTKEIPSAEALERIATVSEEKLYRYRPVLEIEAAGFEVLDGLLDSLVDAAISPRDARRRARLELFPELVLPDSLGRYEILRRITDYVAGMTDSFALSTFRKLRGMELPKMY